MIASSLQRAVVALLLTSCNHVLEGKKHDADYLCREVLAAEGLLVVEKDSPVSVYVDRAHVMSRAETRGMEWELRSFDITGNVDEFGHPEVKFRNSIDGKDPILAIGLPLTDKALYCSFTSPEVGITHRPRGFFK